MTNPNKKNPSIVNQWTQATEILLEEPLASWLLDPGSLTAKLKAQCTLFEVEILNEEEGEITDNERQRLGEHGQGDRFWIREVLLRCDGTAHVFARTVFPMACANENSHYLHMGTQPLGHYLFNDPRTRREDFELGKIASQGPLQEVLKQEQQISLPLWGRRSLFRVGELPILVAEIFLPAALAYKKDV